MLIFGCIFSLFVLTTLHSEGFLIDNTTHSQTSGLTDRHYIAVIDMLLEEKNSRKLLEQTVLNLQQTVYTLQNRNTSQDISDLKQKHDVLSNNYFANKIALDKLQNNVEKLERRYASVLEENKNLTVEIEVLKQSQPVIKALESRLESMVGEINTLKFSYQARNQDLLALYNVTSENKIQIDSSRQDIAQSIQAIRRETTGMYNNETVQIDMLNERINDTDHNLSEVMKQISQMNRTVAMTAKVSTGTVNTTDIIKFTKIKYSYGITNLSAIATSGKFTVEVPGLYIVAVTINSNTNDSAFDVYKNDVSLSTVYIAGRDGKHDQSGSVVITTELTMGDEISMKPWRTSLYVDGQFSTITVVKIK